MKTFLTKLSDRNRDFNILLIIIYYIILLICITNVKNLTLTINIKVQCKWYNISNT